MVHTGTNLVIGWETGEIEWSANDGVTSWTVATPPNSESRRLPIHNDAGTVLFFRAGFGTEYVISTDDGETWDEGNFPSGIEVLGAYFVSGRFVVLGQNASDALLRTSSEDGLTWDPLAAPIFTGPTAALSATLELHEGHPEASQMIAVGDVLLAIFVTSEGIPSAGSELYYSTNLAKTWSPTGTYHAGFGSADDKQVHLAAGRDRFAIIDVNARTWLSLVEPQRVFVVQGAEQTEEAQDTWAFDLNHDPDADYDTGAVESFRILSGNLLVSPQTLDSGNQGLAILARMARGGRIRAERVGTPTENLELRVGPPTNEVTHLSFPILDQWSTTNAGLVAALGGAVSSRFSPPADNWRPRSHFDPSGHHLLMCFEDGAKNSLVQYRCSTPFDANTKVPVFEYDTASLDTTPASVRWGHNGEYIYWYGATSGKLYQYDCGNPYEMAGGADSGSSLTIAALAAFALSSDGTRIVFLTGTTGSRYNGTAGVVASFATASDTVDLASVCSGSATPNHLALHPTNDAILYVGTKTTTTDYYIHRVTLAGVAVMAGATEHSVSPNLASFATDVRDIAVSRDAQYFYLFDRAAESIVRLHNHVLTEDVTYRVGFLPEVAVYLNGAQAVEGDPDIYDWTHELPFILPPLTMTAFRYSWETSLNIAGYDDQEVGISGNLFVSTGNTGEVVHSHSTGYDGGLSLNFAVAPDNDGPGGRFRIVVVSDLTVAAVPPGVVGMLHLEKLYDRPWVESGT
jgi:hypothetical protein